MNTVLAILDAVVNSLWQAVAVTALVWLALKFLRRTNAATRHSIWWATLGVVLLLPAVPWLIVMMRPLPRPTAVRVSTALPRLEAPSVAIEPVIVTVAPDRTGVWPFAILALWAAILAWRLIQIGRSYIFLRGVRSRGTALPLIAPGTSRRVNLLVSREVASPMAVGFLPAAIILPSSLRDELSEPEYEHVVLHETAHLARYDDWSNLAMRLMGGILALHPVALWILRRIECEREMACDDWVVARTGEARAYAASLARMFELRWKRRVEALASGIFGGKSRIGERIELLLQRGRMFSPRASAIVVAASAAVLGCLTFAGALAPRWIAFAQQPSPQQFDVASVKHNNSGDSHWYIRIAPGGKLLAANATLRSLILQAYEVRDFQLLGGPAWLDSGRFDIEGRGKGSPAPGQVLQMLQTLLADRFQLKVRKETRELPVYALLIGKNGLKLEPSRGNGCFDPIADPTAFIAPTKLPCGGFHNASNQMAGANITMSRFTANLSKYVGRAVVDKTGLDGAYDITLRWTPDEAQAFLPAAPSANDSSGPSIFTAVQEQLGLRLESQKGPVEALVIDHVEKPDAN